MFERLKQSLVDSLVGAIALGWLFAQGIVHFVYIFSSPVTTWIMRDEYRKFGDRAAASTGLMFRDALLELIKSLLLLLVGYLLMRWLYFKTDKTERPGPTSNSEQPDSQTPELPSVD